MIAWLGGSPFVMPDKTEISWTDATWNPVTGCTKVSPGCLNCYAESLTARFQWDGPFVSWTVKAQRAAGVSAVTLHPDRLDIPLRWRKPRRIFVNSMSDLFHEDVPGKFISDVFITMSMASQHTFQILTKRPERMQKFVTAWVEYGGHPPVQNILPNVQLGVSVENQRWADERIALLLQTPAAVRFISAEPLLGAVEFDPTWLGWEVIGYDHGARKQIIDHWTKGIHTPRDKPPMIDWVIAGGESGKGRRPADPDWFRSIRDQCVAAGVPFFLKQGNAFKPGQDTFLDGREWHELPEGMTA